MSGSLGLLRAALAEYGRDFAPVSGRPLGSRPAPRPALARWTAILRAAERRFAADAVEVAEWRALRLPPVEPPADVPASGLALVALVAAREATRRGGIEAWRGGWDSAGHWGLDAATAASVWLAARRPTHLGQRARVRRLQVLVGWLLSHPGLGLPRGFGRIPDRGVLAALRQLGRGGCGGRLEARALRRLGELPPEAARAATAGAWERAAAENGGLVPRVVRMRHLDWAAARRVVADPSGRLIVAIARGRRRAALLTERGVDPGGAAAWLAPAYPRLSLEDAAQVATGVSPAALAAAREIGAAQLSRREAHEWAAAGAAETPVAWLVRHLDIGDYSPRSESIARWLVAVERRGAWGQMTRERRQHLPGGEVATWRYVAFLDEILDEDLARGTATRPDDAFRAALARRSDAAIAEMLRHRGDVASVPGPIARALYPRCCRPLTSPAALAREGSEMGHCVAGYLPAVRDGQCVIVALRVGSERSTLELSPTGQVRQHRGPRNGDPSPVLGRLVERIVRRIG